MTKERRRTRNTDFIVAGAGLLGFLVGMTVLWLFWIAVWAEFWRRRIGPKWQAEALGGWWRGLLSRCRCRWARSGFFGS